jgi:exonuclease I
MVGYNSDGFDYHIVHRLCCSAPYNYGPVDDKSLRNKLFHPIHYVDVMKYVWAWTENNVDITSISLDTVREWMGISKVGAHEALKDVRDTAEIFIKFMKLHRNYAGKVKFANAFGGANVLPNV